MKLNRNKNGFGSSDSWQVITNPWPSTLWPTSVPYCKTRSRAVVTWVLQTVIGARIYCRLARHLRNARYWLSYFFFRDRMVNQWTRNSKFHFLDASLYAFVSNDVGTTTFNYHVHGLSPINIARLIRAFEELPLPTKEKLNQLLREERAQTQIA